MTDGSPVQSGYRHVLMCAIRSDFPAGVSVEQHPVK